jgi:hypothetical protein
MAFKEELEAMLTEDRKKLEELKEQLNLLVKEKEELQKSIESEETILKRKFGTRFSRGDEATTKNESDIGRFLHKTIPDAAFEVILEGGNKPIHLKEIFKKVNEGGKSTNQPSSVGVALRRDKRFKLIGPNVFAIVEEEYRKAKEKEVMK